MSISEYKNILFISDDIETNCSYEIEFNSDNKVLDNRLNTLDDLKEQFITDISQNKNIGKEFNIVKNFKYGQKESLFSFDGNVFYGSGILSYVDQDTYQILRPTNNETSQLLVEYQNEALYKDAPIQIDHIFLYKSKENYIGKIKLKNMSDEQIQSVLLKITPIDSAGRKSSQTIQHQITATSHYSFIEFDKQHTIIFHENNMRTFTCEIIEVVSNRNRYDYSNFKRPIINHSPTSENKTISKGTNEEQIQKKRAKLKRKKNKKLAIYFIAIISFALLIRYCCFQPIKNNTNNETLETVQNIKKNIINGNYETSIDEIMELEDNPVHIIKKTSEHKKEYYDQNDNLLLTLTIDDEKEAELSIQCEAAIDHYKFTFITLYKAKNKYTCPLNDRGYIQITFFCPDGKYVNYQEIISLFSKYPQHYILKIAQVLGIDFIDRCQFISDSYHSIKQTNIPHLWGKNIEENTDILIDYSRIIQKYYHYY